MATTLTSGNTATVYAPLSSSTSIVFDAPTQAQISGQNLATGLSIPPQTLSETTTVVLNSGDRLNITAVGGDLTYTNPDIGETGTTDYVLTIANGVPVWAENAATSDLDIASQAEAEAGEDNTKAMTPLRVAQAIDAQATALEIASEVEATTGTDNTKAMTPLRVAQAIAELVPPVEITAASQAEAEAQTSNVVTATPLSLKYWSQANAINNSLTYAQIVAAAGSYVAGVTYVSSDAVDGRRVQAFAVSADEAIWQIGVGPVYWGIGAWADAPTAVSHPSLQAGDTWDANDLGNAAVVKCVWNGTYWVPFGGRAMFYNMGAPQAAYGTGTVAETELVELTLPALLLAPATAGLWIYASAIRSGTTDAFTLKSYIGSSSTYSENGSIWNLPLSSTTLSAGCSALIKRVSNTALTRMGAGGAGNVATMNATSTAAQVATVDPAPANLTTTANYLQFTVAKAGTTDTATLQHLAVYWEAC